MNPFSNIVIQLDQFLAVFANYSIRECDANISI